MITRESTFRGVQFVGAPVSKPLASVKRICMAGHTVVFDEQGSYIINKSTGEVNSLREEQGNYMLDIYVPPSEWIRQQSQPQDSNTGFGWQQP